MQDLHNKVLSILFSVGKKIELSEIARLCHKGNNLDQVESILNDLKEQYADPSKPFIVTNDGTLWKMTIKDQYIPVVTKLGIKTELTKTVMETLAVIAYKAPAIQSEIIKIRTNKAYDHIADLENLGYITRTRYGRSKLIKLTPKFFEYFDVPPDKIKERFASVAKMESEVKDLEWDARQKRQELDEIKAQRTHKEEEQRIDDQRKATDLDDEIETKEPSQSHVEERKQELEVYTSKEDPAINIKPFETEGTPIKKDVDHMGVLEVYDEPSSEIDKEEIKKLKDGKTKTLAGLEIVSVNELQSEEEQDENEENQEESQEENTLDDSESYTSTDNFDLLSKPSHTSEEKDSSEPDNSSHSQEAQNEQAPGQERTSSPAPAQSSHSSPAVKQDTNIEHHSSQETDDRITFEQIKEEALKSAQELPQKEIQGERLFKENKPVGFNERVDQRVREIVYGTSEAGEQNGQQPFSEPEVGDTPSNPNGSDESNQPSSSEVTPAATEENNNEQSEESPSLSDQPTEEKGSEANPQEQSTSPNSENDEGEHNISS